MCVIVSLTSFYLSCLHVYEVLVKSLESIILIDRQFVILVVILHFGCGDVLRWRGGSMLCPWGRGCS